MKDKVGWVNKVEILVQVQKSAKTVLELIVWEWH